MMIGCETDGMQIVSVCCFPSKSGTKVEMVLSLLSICCHAHYNHVHPRLHHNDAFE